MGVRVIRALLMGVYVYVRAPDFLKLPHELQSTSLIVGQ